MDNIEFAFRYFVQHGTYLHDTYSFDIRSRHLNHVIVNFTAISGTRLTDAPWSGLHITWMRDTPASNSYKLAISMTKRYFTSLLIIKAIIVGVYKGIWTAKLSFVRNLNGLDSVYFRSHKSHLVAETEQEEIAFEYKYRWNPLNTFPISSGRPRSATASGIESWYCWCAPRITHSAQI